MQLCMYHYAFAVSSPQEVGASNFLETQDLTQNKTEYSLILRFESHSYIYFGVGGLHGNQVC